MKLWHYILGSRKGIEAHEVEKEAMRDPFLADALAGYETAQGNPQRKVARLQKEINRRQKRTEGTSEKKGVTQMIWIAAAAIIILAAAATLYYIYTHKAETTPAQMSARTTSPPPPSIQQQTEEPQPETATATEPAIEPARKEIKKETKITAIEEITPEEQPATPNIASSPSPQPVNGMASFEAYIKRNLTHPTDEECSEVKGSVIVTFKVGQSGRPYNIKVAEGLCGSINQEAIRLIINGPDWMRGTETDEMRVTIGF